MKKTLHAAAIVVLLLAAILFAGCGQRAGTPEETGEGPVTAPVREIPEAGGPEEDQSEQPDARPGRVARSLDLEVSGGLVPRRRYETSALPVTDPVRWGDYLIVGAADGDLIALSVKDGTPVWRRRLEETPVSLAAGRGALFVGTGKAILRISPVTGEEEWRLSLDGDAVVTRFTVSATMLYAGLESGAIVAVSRDEGELRWRSRTRGRPLDRLNVADGVVYANTSPGTLHAFEAGTGEPLWEYRSGGRFAAGPGVADGRIGVATTSGEVTILDTGGAVTNEWSVSGAPLLVAPFLEPGRLVLADAAGTIHAYSPDGSLLWRSSLTTHLAGLPARLGDVLVVSENGGGAVSLDMRTGEEISRVAFGDAASGEATVYEETLYWVLRDGSLRALAVNGELRRVPLLSEEGSWVLPESGTFRLIDKRVALRMRSDRDAVFEITVSSAPAEDLLLRVMTESGATVATNMGKVTLERSIRAALDADSSYQLVIERPEASGEVTITVETEQLQ